MKIQRLLAVLFLLSGLSLAQLSRVHSDVAFKADGRPAGGASVRVCTAAATGVPCSPLATIYSDEGLTTQKSNPFSADGTGNYSYYAASALYKEQVNVGGAIYTHPVQLTDPAVGDLLALKADLSGGKVVQSQVASGDTTNSTLCIKGGSPFFMGSCGSGGGSGDAVTIQTNNVATGTVSNKGEGYFYNGTALTLRKNGWDNHADDWGCDKTGATGASSCLNSMIRSVSTSTGQSVKIPAGTYLIDSPLHISRSVNIEGDGGSATTPQTVWQLGPGANITFDKSTVSSDGGGSDWSVFKGVRVVGKFISCTATSGNGTLASCNANPSTALSLSANDYLVVMGFNGTALWGLTVPQGTQVASTTSNSITLAGGVLASASGAVTVMKAGYVNGSGTTTNSSTSITGVATACALWQPGDPIQGPGIPYPDYVTGCNTGASTLTLLTAAGAGAGAGNLTKGPLANVVVHAGTITAEDISIDYSAGYGYDVHGQAGYTPSMIADGQYPWRMRITRAGDACMHFKGADSNTSITMGVQSTYCANGNIKDESFLGNTHIGAQVASSSGDSYQATSVNASNVWINPYTEGGQYAPTFTTTNLILGGNSNAKSRGISNGNYISANGLMSPSFFWQNDTSSTATCTNGSSTLTNVTNISNWKIGNPVIGGCIAANATVTATDGVSQLTISSNATANANLMPITSVRTSARNGTTNSTGNDIYGFGYSINGSSSFDYLFGFVDPYKSSSSTELGTWQYQYRAAANAFALTTDASTAAWDFPGSGNNYGYPVFPKGVTIGALANKVDVRANASASAPTSGLWHNGGLAISTTNGVFQQRNAGKSTTGTADTTLGSTTIANQDANFLARCAPGDSVTGTGIQNAVYLVDQSTLSKTATATNTGVTFTCKRLPKAHLATTCDTHTNATVDNCSTVSGWAVNDTIQGTGFATGTFITAIVGTTFTVSKATTATNTGVSVFDATWGTGVFSDTAGVYSLPNLTLSTITGSAQCLQVNSSGVVSGTGSTCGTGGAGASPGGSSGDIQINSAGVFGGVATIGSGNVVRGTNPAIAGLTLSGITGTTQCLHADSAGLVSGTGVDCGVAGTGTPGVKAMSSYANAQTALNALTAGDTMIVNGTYSLCSGTIAAANVTIKAGYQGGILQCGTNNVPVLTISTNGVELHGITIQHTVLPIAGGDGVVVNGNLVSTDINHCKIQKNYIGANLGDTSSSRFEQNYVQLNENDGVHFTPNSSRPVMQWYVTGDLSQKNLGWGYRMELPNTFNSVHNTGPWFSGWTQTFGNALGGFAFIGSAATASGISDVWMGDVFSSQDNGTGFYFDNGSNGGRNVIAANLYAEQEGTYNGVAGYASAVQVPTNAGYGIYFTSACDPTPGPVLTGAVTWENSDSGVRSDCAGTTMSNIQAFKNGMAGSANSYQRAGVAIRGSNSSVIGGYMRDSGSNMINGVDISNSATNLIISVNCDASVATCYQPTTSPTKLIKNIPGQTPWLACNGKGLGDGLNSMAAGTYLQYTCLNNTGFTVTLSSLRCWTDNAGTSSMNAANNAGTSLLTGAVTCNNTKSNGGAAGTQSATTTLANGDAISFTFVADGTTKQANFSVAGVY